MRKLAVTLALLICLAAASSADAAITSVFGSVSCTVSSTAGQVGNRICGNSTAQVATWDGMPIDVSVAFPPASGSDTNWPVVGIFHGWGGSKILPTSATAQRWLNQGYAVFSITDRGWGSSCGGANLGLEKTGACKKGYIRLMHNAYEVRDVQYLLGKLADEGVIDPQKIGATGGSYGGGMSLQLGALKDRVQMPDGSLVQWQSPNGTPMKIAATAPEFPWSDLAQSLMPNGSSLDYVADSPYEGVNGDHRFGIQKNNWNGSLFLAAQVLGYLAPTSGAGYPDVTANLSAWNTFNSTGGPYDGQTLAIQQATELRNHSGYYQDLSQPPAPALLSSGWNDDLFPVDETVRYYNKVRSKFPNTPMKMFDLDFGHNPRAATVAPADAAKLVAAENAWFDKYVKGTGSTPSNATGGVDILTSNCSGTATTAGTQFTADDWASLAPGEIVLQDGSTKTVVAPGTAPSQAFTSGNICSVTQAAGDNASAATYKLAAAPASGFTIAGSPTIIAEFNTVGANDMLAGRLYDVAPGGTQQLIARGLYRPLAVGGGYTKQVWQLHPQAWKVAAGHVVKLELLTQDSTYARLTPTSGPGVRNSVGVRNLELRLPTVDAPGAAGGLVGIPQAKYLPSGYTLARDVQTTVPGAPHISSGDNPNATGIFGLAWTASQAAAGLRYSLQHRDSNDASWSNVDNNLSTNSYDFTAGSPEGEGTWTYQTNAHEDDGDPSTGYSDSSAAIKVDKTKPNKPTVSADRAPDYAGGGGWYRDSVDVFVTDNGDPALADGSDGSGVDVGSLRPTETYNTAGSHTFTATAKDTVGNESDPDSLTVQVDPDDPSTTLSGFTTDWQASALPVSLSAQDGSGSGVDKTYVAIHQSASPPSTGDAAWKQYDGSTLQLNDGDRVSYYSVDNAGNREPVSTSAAARIDTAKPSTTLQGFTTDWQATALPVTLTADDGAGSGVDKTYYAIHQSSSAPGMGDSAWSVYDGSTLYLNQGDRVSYYSVDAVGNTESVSTSAAARIDTAKPSTTLQGFTTNWQASALPVTLTAADGAGSGVDKTRYVIHQSASPPAVGDPAWNVYSGATLYLNHGDRVSYYSADSVGNTEAVSTSAAARIDTTPPALNLSCPAAVLLNASGVNATFTASDGQSGLASAASGSVAVDTSFVGIRTVTRTATDNVGNQTTKSCSTAVQYMYSGLLQPINPDGSSIFKAGSTVPVKFSLTNAQAGLVGTAAATLTIAKISNNIEGTFVEAVSTANATTGNLFRSDGGQYIFNLSTKGLAAGTYSIKVSIDDGTSYTTHISLK